MNYGEYYQPPNPFYGPRQPVYYPPPAAPPPVAHYVAPAYHQPYYPAHPYAAHPQPYPQLPPPPPRAATFPRPLPPIPQRPPSPQPRGRGGRRRRQPKAEPFDEARWQQEDVAREHALYRQYLINMANGAEPKLPPGWEEYYTARLDVSYLTVDRQKQALRFINSRTHSGLRLSGNKPELTERIRSKLDEAKNTLNLTLYNTIRGCISDAAQHHPGAHYVPAPAAAAPAPAPTVQPPAYVPPAQPRYQAPPVAGPSHQPYQPPVQDHRYQHNGASAVAAARPAAPPNAGTLGLPINFRSSPFFRIESGAMSVITMPAAPAGDRKTVSAQIGLTADQRQKLMEAKVSPNNPQYQLRIFCCTDSYYLPGSSYGYNRGQAVAPSQLRGPAPVEFPAACEVKVNGINIGSSKLRGIKKKEGSAAPPDISTHLALPTGSLNRVEVVYINTDKRYFGIVYLVESFSVAQVLDRIKKGKFRSKEDIVTSIRKAAEDDEIQATSSELSLKDPLTFTRLATPLRSIRCEHLQCFDGEVFLTMMEQTPTWDCPVCNKVLKYDELAVDGFVEDVLKNTSSSVESVHVDEHGVWSAPAANGRSKSPSKSRKTSQALDSDGESDLDDDDDALLVIAGSSRPTAARAAAAAGVINLDGTSPAVSPRPRSAQPAVFIDLTTSDDEPPPAPASRANGSAAPSSGAAPAGAFQTWANGGNALAAAGQKRTASDSFGDEGDARGAPRGRYDEADRRW